VPGWVRLFLSLCRTRHRHRIGGKPGRDRRGSSRHLVRGHGRPVHRGGPSQRLRGGHCVPVSLPELASSFRRPLIFRLHIVLIRMVTKVSSDPTVPTIPVLAIHM
jgi:hypothetical protein